MSAPCTCRRSSIAGVGGATADPNAVLQGTMSCSRTVPMAGTTPVASSECVEGRARASPVLDVASREIHWHSNLTMERTAAVQLATVINQPVGIPPHLSLPPFPSPALDLHHDQRPERARSVSTEISRGVQRHFHTGRWQLPYR